MQNDKKGYGLVYREFMRNPSLTIEAKSIFNYLVSFAGQKEECYPGKELMLSELNISEQRFDKHMKQLVERGYVEKKRLRKNGKLSNNVYKIEPFPNSVLDTEKPHIENLGIENQGVENLDAENQGIENLHLENLLLENLGMENVGHNNNSINNNSINNNSIKDVANSATSPIDTEVKRGKEKSVITKKEKYGEYNHVKLTDSERERLINEFGQDVFAKSIKKLDEYIQETGKKYKDHNLTIRRWVIDAVKNNTNTKKGEEVAYGDNYSTNNCYSMEYYDQFRGSE